MVQFQNPLQRVGAAVNLKNVKVCTHILWVGATHVPVMDQWMHSCNLYNLSDLLKKNIIEHWFSTSEVIIRGRANEHSYL